MKSSKSQKKILLKSQKKISLKSPQKNSLLFDQIRDINFFSSIAFIFSIIIVFICLRSAYTTFLFPIYSDEIAERHLLSRIVYDFPIKLDTLPMCNASINTTSYPKLWYFPAMVDWLIHGQVFDFKVFRFIGVITGWLVFLLLTVRLCYKNMQFFNSFYKKIMFIFFALGGVLSLMEIGVVPFFLVMLRPEQCILLLLVILLIIFSITAETIYKKIALTLAYFMTVSVLFYLHAKTLFLLPVLIIIACKIFSHFKNRYMFTFLLCLLFIIVIGNYEQWVNYVDCSNSPILNKSLKNFNVDLRNIVHKPSLFFSEIWNNVYNFKINIKGILFQLNPQANYIPAVKIDNSINIFNKIIFFNYIVIFLVLFSASMVSCALDLHKRHYLTNNVLTFALFLCAIASLLLNKNKNWYDSGYLWSLLVITFVFYISAWVPYLSKRKITYIFMSYFLGVGILSQSLFIGAYEAPFEDGWQASFISLSKYKYKETNEELDKLSALCGIDKNKSKNLILDDATYLYFQRSKLPLAYTYIFYAVDRQFLHGFWNKLNIDGMVLRTYNIPEEFRAKYAIQVGNFICVPKKNIAPLFEEMLAAFGI